MTHPWCLDTQRDEAVRAAEDGRTGPLPTLEECIAAVTNCRSDQTKGDEMLQGLRTERVTLEIKHYDDNDSDSVYRWNWAEMMSEQGLGINESVRVVDEFGTALPRVVEDLAAEIKRLDAERDALQARVAELEARTSTAGEGSCAAPARPGRLTAEERKAVESVRLHLSSLDGVDAATERECRWASAVLERLLARSTPPEVVLPGKQVRYHSMSVEDQRDAQWISALAAAGVAVKEVAADG